MNKDIAGMGMSSFADQRSLRERSTAGDRGLSEQGIGERGLVDRNLERASLGKPSSYEKSFLHRLVRALSALDVWMLFFAVLLCTMAVLDMGVVKEWPMVFAYSGLIAGMIFLMAAVRLRQTEGFWHHAQLLVHYLLIPVFFRAADRISHSLHGHDFDDVLIAADRYIFHGDPTVWLTAHIPAVPQFVAFMQICYFAFYFVPFAIIVEMYMRRLNRQAGDSYVRDYDEYEQAFFLVVYGFFLSYIAYFMFPAIGPRFTLHDFSMLSKDLPGDAVTEWVRRVLNSGENILVGMSAEQARAVVTRDAFPSGHTEITVLSMILAYKFKATLRWPIYIIGASIVFATVYLRYHYVIDLVGGLALVPIALYTWEYVRKGMLAIRRWVLVRI